MIEIFAYYPCNSKGVLLKGFCRTCGSNRSLLTDLKIWLSFGVKFVCINGIVEKLTLSMIKLNSKKD